MQSRRNTENWEPHTASLIYSESHWIALVGPVRRQANHSEIKVLLNTNTNGKMYSFPFWKLCFQFWMLQTASAYCFSLHSFVSPSCFSDAVAPCFPLGIRTLCSLFCFPLPPHLSRVFLSPSLSSSIHWGFIVFVFLPRWSPTPYASLSQMDHIRHGRKTEGKESYLKCISFTQVSLNTLNLGWAKSRCYSVQVNVGYFLSPKKYL